MLVFKTRCSPESHGHPAAFKYQLVNYHTQFSSYIKQLLLSNIKSNFYFEGELFSLPTASGNH